MAKTEEPWRLTFSEMVSPIEAVIEESEDARHRGGLPGSRTAGDLATVQVSRLANASILARDDGQRLLRREAAGTVLLQEGCNPVRNGFGGHAAPVVLLPRQGDASIDHLQRPVQLRPVERRAQRRVPVDDPLPGRTERRDVELIGEAATIALSVKADVLNR